MKHILLTLAVRLLGILFLVIGGGGTVIEVSKTSWRMIGIWWMSLYTAIVIAISLFFAGFLLVWTPGRDAEGKEK